MKILKHTIILVALGFGCVCNAGEYVDQLFAEYAEIETVSCQIRRTVDGSLGKMKFLSRVYYTNKNQLHAENITPIKRHTISDGSVLHQYAEGDPKGFSRPVAALSSKMRVSLEKVPGTAMDHLWHLKGKQETVLSGAGAFPVKVGIDGGSRYAVLLFDRQKRLVGLSYFESPAQKKLVAKYTFADYREVLPSVWISFLHKGQHYQHGQESKETIRIDRFVVNEPIAASLFIYSNFFDKKIDFVDDYSKIQAD